MRGGKCFAVQVSYPVPELFMTRRDEAAPIAIKGVTNGEFVFKAVTVIGEVWGL